MVLNAVVLLKKTTLNPEILKNYRPVPNLSFPLKILEKVVLHQLSNHLLTNHLLHQSAYCTGHCMKTALLKIISDLLPALDKDKVSLLSLPDLYAAFDTNDRSILVSRLSHSFGISDTVLAWFTSCFSDCTQFVSANGSKSLPAPLHYGVLQGYC